jgi:hypothetical protein
MKMISYQERLLENNKAPIEFLLTLRPGYKAGIKMRLDVYESIKNEIIDLVRQEEGVSLPSFFEILHSKFVDLLGVETGWFLYHVKLDLEMRSVIKAERSKGKRNVRTVIKMTPAYRKEKSRLTVL